MKKGIVLLIIVLLGLCGCQNSQATNITTNRFGEEIMIIDDIEIPAALGKPQISDRNLEDIKALTSPQRKEKINTYADAIKYLNSLSEQDNKTIIDTIYSCIDGDYEDVKIIDVFSNNSIYYLLSIKTDGKYYLLDPSTSLYVNKQWLYGIEVDSGSFSSLDSLIEVLKGVYSDENTIIFTKDIEQTLDITIKSGDYFYSFMGTVFPLVLGLPQLSEKELNNIDEADARDKLNNIADYFAYVKNVKPVDSPSQIVQLAINYLFGDYDEVGQIEISFESGNDSVMYIKTNNKYYPMHLFSQYMSGNNEFYNNERVNCSFDNIKDTENATVVLFSGTPNGKVINTVITSFPYLGHIIGPNGEKLYITELNGEKAYRFKDYYYLKDYGEPELSDQDIENLISKMNEGDYETVRNSIKTIPDFVNLFKSCGFKENKGIVTTNQYYGPNVGHVIYRDEGETLEYTISPIESMIVKEGQCDSTATLFHYFFNDKFDEEGYVLIQCFNESYRFGYGCHAINYFKTNGKYYLFSPSYALTDDGAWEAHGDLWTGKDSLEELAQTLYDSRYPNGKVAVLVLFEYDGSLAEGRTFDNRYDPSKNHITLPEGADVKISYSINISFVKPMHSTSLDHIIGIQTQ